MTTLRSARLELHYAARLLASTAHAMIRHEEDDSHSALTLDNGGAYLETQLLNTKGLTLCLALRELRLEWRRGAHVLEGAALAGLRMDDGYRWLNETRPPDAPLIVEREFPDFPDHPLAATGTFSTHGDTARTQLAGEFGAADAALHALLESESGASARYVWPHHFDLGALLTEPGEGRMVGLGFSPGDSSYDEPYYYVSPYPQPESGQLPAWKGAGHWHTDGFTSVILTATERDAASPERDTATGTANGRVSSFLSNALATARSLIA